MVTQRAARATFADLELLGDVRAEIVNGSIVDRAAPSFDHSLVQAGMSAGIGRRFHRKSGGRWPGGWWIASEAEVQYRSEEVFIHDLAGWSRVRMPEPARGRPVTLRPDWVCELLSPSNSRRDLVEKLGVLHACEVLYYWIVNPEAGTIDVHRWAPAGYTIVLAATTGERVRAEPFDSVELRVGTLFGGEDDDE